MADYDRCHGGKKQQRRELERARRRGLSKFKHDDQGRSHGEGDIGTKKWRWLGSKYETKERLLPIKNTEAKN